MSVSRTIATLAAALVAASAAGAQSPVADPGPGTAFWVQLQRPSLESDISSLLLDAGGQLRLGSRSLLVLRVPVAHVAEDLPPGFSATLIGNPYIGLRQRTGNADFEVGARMPIVNDDGSTAAPSLVGILADYDQFEAYVPDVLSLYLRLGMASAPASGSGPVTRIRIGPTVFVPRTDDPSDETEVMADYSGYLGYRTARVEAGAAITGRFMVTVDGGSLGERTVHQLTLGGSLRGGRIRPHAFVRLPLDDDLKEELKSVIGVGLVVGLR